MNSVTRRSLLQVTAASAAARFKSGSHVKAG